MDEDWVSAANENVAKLCERWGISPRTPLADLTPEQWAAIWKASNPPHRVVEELLGRMVWAENYMNDFLARHEIPGEDVMRLSERVQVLWRRTKRPMSEFWNSTPRQTFGYFEKHVRGFKTGGLQLPLSVSFRPDVFMFSLRKEDPNPRRKAFLDEQFQIMLGGLLLVTASHPEPARLSRCVALIAYGTQIVFGPEGPRTQIVYGRQSPYLCPETQKWTKRYVEWHYPLPAGAGEALFRPNSVPTETRMLLNEIKKNRESQIGRGAPPIPLAPSTNTVTDDELELAMERAKNAKHHGISRKGQTLRGPWPDCDVDDLYQNACYHLVREKEDYPVGHPERTAWVKRLIDERLIRDCSTEVRRLRRWQPLPSAETSSEKLVSGVQDDEEYRETPDACIQPDDELPFHIGIGSEEHTPHKRKLLDRRLHVLVLTLAGETEEEIAAKLGIDQTTVNRDKIAIVRLARARVASDSPPAEGFSRCVVCEAHVRIRRPGIGTASHPVCANDSCYRAWLGRSRPIHRPVRTIRALISRESPPEY